MAQKSKIQYVGEFYVHGSEAKKLAPKAEPRQKKAALPILRLTPAKQVAVDPLAIVSIGLALVLLICMMSQVGAIQSDWAEYEQMSGYVTELRRQNAELAYTYRSGYDLDLIEAQALSMGLVPAADLQSEFLYVTEPVPRQELTYWQELGWFLKGLFA